MVPFSVLIIARDEEANLSDLMPTLGWCDDVVVVDDESTDDTRRVAEAAGARVFRRAFDSFAGQRNWALDNVPFQHEWVFHLDADERMPGELVREIERVIVETTLDGFWVASKLMFYGRWIRRASGFPVYQMRLGRNPGVSFIQAGHGQRENCRDEQLGVLREALLHWNFSKGLEEWIEKHNRYSTDEARAAIEDEGGAIGALFSRNGIERRRAVKRLLRGVPFRSTLRFSYLYLGRLGFLDGLAGLHYCRLVAMYELMIELKMREGRLARDGRSSEMGGRPRKRAEWLGGSRE